MEDTENIKGSFEEVKESQGFRAKVKARLVWVLERVAERVLWLVLTAAMTLVLGVSVALYERWETAGSTTGSLALVDETEEKGFAVVERPVQELKRAVTGKQRISIDSLRANAEQGFKRAQYQLGLLHFTGSHHRVARDQKRAVDWWEKSAAQGYAAAQNALGFAYWKGEGVEEEDREEAVARYELAAEQDFFLAQYNLGVAYWKGEGVGKQDFSEAVRLWRLAAKQGLPEAQYDLAEALWKGKGKVVKKDPKSAVKWYEKAADKGHLQALFRLGKIYLEVEKEPQKAIRQLKLAAKKGLGEAQYEVGVAYEKGVGVPQSYRDAYSWFASAATAGYGDASQKRDDTRERLDQATIGAVDSDVNARQQKIDALREHTEKEQQEQFLVTR